MNLLARGAARVKRSSRELRGMLSARSGSSFDSRVERDHADARAKRKQARVTAELGMLVLANGTSYAKREDAVAGLEELWPKNPQDADGRNDLAVGFAWVERWEEALTEIDKAVNAAEITAKKKRADTKEVIEAAAGADAATHSTIGKAIDAGGGTEAAATRSAALEAIGLADKKKRGEIDESIKAAAAAQAVKQRAEENRTRICRAREAAVG